MNKGYWEYLKKHDSIHYSEMMGDPVTGLDSSPGCSLAFVGLVIFILVIGFLIGVVV